MNDQNVARVKHLARFNQGANLVQFTATTTAEAYTWIATVLKRFNYHHLRKKEKSDVFAYLQTMTGYSRQQLTRLIAQHRKFGKISVKNYGRNCFVSHYTKADILLLAKTDELHQTLSGPATKKICERAFDVFHQTEYERLASISVSHLYNLRQSYCYRQHR